MNPAIARPSNQSPSTTFRQLLTFRHLKVVKMGFSFKGLTSAALVSRQENDATGVSKDIADVPASYAGHTSMDVPRPDDKLGAPRSESDAMDSDDELNRVDASAEHGVQRAQAMTHVWSKKDLILAYIL
jgi:hypothetical protein